MSNIKQTVFITGAAGYVGAMLIERFAKRKDVAKIIGLDKEPVPEIIAGEQKLIYIQGNTSDGKWESLARKHSPDIVIHTAWQIRDMYGDSAMQRKWNIYGSDAVFKFAFEEPSVTRLIYFSSVASYGAYADNSVDRVFNENDAFRKSDYRYAEEKRECEEHLQAQFETAKKDGNKTTVAIVRPAAITGPRGRFARIRFGLQSALSGQLKGSSVYRLVSLLTAFVPVTKEWTRQFVHEDDVYSIVELLSFAPRDGYEAYNLCPPGSPVRGSDMARAVGKRMIVIPTLFVRIAFFILWHITRGIVPTSRGAWKGYSYPIVVDGSKITRDYGYHYTISSYDAFYFTDGHYSSCVPKSAIRSRDI